MGDDQIRRLLKDEGFSFQRPKHTLQGKRDEAALERGRQQLQERKQQALGPNAALALVFQDEVEIHKLPAWTRVWAEVGSQPEGPSPGKNEKPVIDGGIDYLKGTISYPVAATKSGVNFLAFLVALVAVYVGRQVVLVCDNGRFHTTKAVPAWLEANRDKVEIYWLPPYSPSLNLIERLGAIGNGRGWPTSCSRRGTTWWPQRGAGWRTSTVSVAAGASSSTRTISWARNRPGWLADSFCVST